MICVCAHMFHIYSKFKIKLLVYNMSNVYGVVLIDDEPLNSVLIKWFGWLIVMILFICILVKISKINVICIDKMIEKANSNTLNRLNAEKY